jgi:hypothetical protein
MHLKGVFLILHPGHPPLAFWSNKGRGQRLPQTAEAAHHPLKVFADRPAVEACRAYLGVAPAVCLLLGPVSRGMVPGAHGGGGAAGAAVAEGGALHGGEDGAALPHAGHCPPPHFDR